MRYILLLSRPHIMAYTFTMKYNNSRGAYVLKYILEWNGVEMRNTFT
jgi:hypothetical protein